MLRPVLPRKLYLFDSEFKIDLPSYSGSSRWFLAFRFPNWYFVRCFIPPVRISCAARPIFDHRNVFFSSKYCETAYFILSIHLFLSPCYVRTFSPSVCLFSGAHALLILRHSSHWNRDRPKRCRCSLATALLRQRQSNRREDSVLGSFIFGGRVGGRVAVPTGMKSNNKITAGTVSI